MSEMLTAVTKSGIMSHGVTSSLASYVGEAVLQISEIEDPEEKRSALDALWSYIEKKDGQADLISQVARLETAHEHRGAQIQSLVEQLEAFSFEG